MNKKGFTLTELLAVVVILGIISGLSIPLIRNLSSTFEKNKYKYYAESVLSSAKLYNNSYSEDIFGRKQYGCGYVTYEQLTDKKLLKDISDDKITCATNETFVKIFKRKDKYSYKVFLGCNKKNSTDTTLIRYPEDTTEVIDTESCTGSLPNNIKIEVDDTQMGEDVPIKKKKTTTLYLSSGTGIASNVSISTAWSTVDKGWNNVDESAWTKQTFSVPKHQESQIDQGETIVATSKTISTPANETGKVYLLVRVDELKDIYDSNWANKNQEDGKFLSFGPFIIDNLGPKVTAEVYNCATDEETGNPTPTGNLITTKTVRGITDVATVSTKDITGNENTWLNASTSPVGVCTKFKAEDESGLDYYIRGSNEHQLPANEEGYKTIANTSDPKPLTEATKCKDEDGNDIDNCVTKNIWVKDNGHKYVVYDVYDKLGNYTSLIYDLKRDAIQPNCGDTDAIEAESMVTVECTDGGGSGCVKNPYTATYEAGAESVEVTIKDNAKNSTKCKVKTTASAPKMNMRVYKCSPNNTPMGDPIAEKENKKVSFTIDLNDWYTHNMCIMYEFASTTKISFAYLAWNKAGYGIGDKDYKDKCSGCAYSSKSGSNYNSTIAKLVGKKSGTYDTYIGGTGHRYIWLQLKNEAGQVIDGTLDVWLDQKNPTASHSTTTKGVNAPNYKAAKAPSAYIKIKCDDSMSGCDTKKGDIGSQKVSSDSKTFTVYDKAGNSATTTVKRNFSHCVVWHISSKKCTDPVKDGGYGMSNKNWTGSSSGSSSNGDCKVTSESICKKHGKDPTTYYYKFS